MPIVCVDPRSESLVTTAGLISTHTTLTHDGSMLPTPMLCSIDDSMIDHVDAGERLGIGVLRRDEVHDRLGQRAVVSNRAGEEVADAVRVTRVHDAGRQHAGSDGLGDAAGAADRVDRAHVIAMAVLDRMARS